MEMMPFTYLTSPPFSGSTLFSFLVNTHPKIATVGEMTGPLSWHKADTYSCSCGHNIRECAFWIRVAAQMETRGFSFDPSTFDTRIRLGNGQRAERFLSGSLRSTLLEEFRDSAINLWPRQRRRLHYLVARNKALAASVLQVAGKALYFDASKNPMAIRQFSRQPDVDLRVVHLVRDVRGASLSKRKNQGEANWGRAVTAWIRLNRNIERQLRRLPTDRWIRIRYEDLCRAPTATMHRFFEFCGVEPHSMPLHFSSQEHHIVGNRMRLSNLGQIKLDEDWRRTLTPDEVTLAWKLAGPMHVRYGYPQMSAMDLTS
jgi:hypothetical protein